MRYKEIAMPVNEQIMVINGLVFSNLSNFIPPKTPKAMTAPISNAMLEYLAY